MDTLLLKANDSKAIELSSEFIRKGEVIAVPTETVYGFVCDWNNPEAIKKIYQLKGRNFHKPLAAFCYNTDMIKNLVAEINQNALLLIDYFMPGPITLLMKRNPIIKDYSNNSTNIIGIRIPQNNFVLNLLQELRSPLASTSANISGHSPLINAGDIFKFFEGKIPLIIDGGNANLGIASTVIDVTVNPPEIIRQGSVTEEQIKKVLELNDKG